MVKAIKKIESSLVKCSPGCLILPPDLEIFSLQDRMDAANVPGVSVAVINNNQLEWAKGYGVLRKGTDKAVTTETIFQACSVSKMVTTPLVLHLVEMDVFDLDENVNSYLRAWKVPENEFTQINKVTLRSLLTHQSGISRPDGGYEWEEGSNPTIPQILKGESPALTQPTTVEFEPGSQWQYSNNGFVVIQLMLEEYYNKPFEQIAKEFLLDPLGMKNATFTYPLSSSWSEREISLHNSNGVPTYPGIIPTAKAHGGLMTTASDLALYAIALSQSYQGTTRGIISNRLAQMMLNQKVWVDDTSAVGFPFGMGFGCFIAIEGESEIFFHPGGNDPGASCLVCLMPGKGVGAVIMTNGLNGFTLSIELLSAIAHEYQWQ